MFEPSNRYTLATHDGPYASWPLTTPLLCDGQPTGMDVPGYLIEGQYRWGDHALLILSWDCPYEEACDVVLLDQHHATVAHASLGVPYGSFVLYAHWPIDAHSIRLHFYRQMIYTLSIQPPAGWLRRRYRLRLSSHFVPPSDARTQASIRELRRALDADVS